MSKTLRRYLLAFLRISERPDPPEGSEQSISMFRASTKYFWYSALSWALRQAGLLFGLLIPLGIIDRIVNVQIGGITAIPETVAGIPFKVVEGLVGISADRLILWAQVLAFTAFVIQFVTSGLFLRLAWEMRWYIVTDKAIRIREGLFRVNEQTLTIAKIQNLRIHQGPLQRLFGIADLEVQTAGGGGGSSSKSDDEHKARLGRFRGIEGVESLRNRLRALQVQHGDTGLGERPARRTRSTAANGSRAAAEKLLQEARLLRQSLSEQSV